MSDRLPNGQSIAFLFSASRVSDFKGRFQIIQPRQKQTGELQSGLPGIHPLSVKGAGAFAERNQLKIRLFWACWSRAGSVCEINCFLEHSL